MSGEYWVRGTDGREYGPVGLDAVARWVREGRIVGQTLVRKGLSPAVEARTLPELAGFFGLAAGAPSSPPPGAGAPAQGAPGAAPGATAGALAGATAPPTAAWPSQLGAWDLLGRAWELVKPHWLPLAAMFFIISAIGCVPYVGACVQFIIGGAIAVGIWRAILGMIDGRAPNVGMMFEGFDRFGDAFLAYLVRMILIVLGLALLIVPGIILMVMWAFTFPVIAETPLGFWEAMRRSAVLTEGFRWQLFVLALACIPILLLGLLAACVGIFVAIPVCVTAFGLAYRSLQARKAGSPQAA